MLCIKTFHVPSEDIQDFEVIATCPKCEISRVFPPHSLKGEIDKWSAFWTHGELNHATALEIGDGIENEFILQRRCLRCSEKVVSRMCSMLNWDSEVICNSCGTINLVGDGAQERARRHLCEEAEMELVNDKLQGNCRRCRSRFEFGPEVLERKHIHCTTCFHPFPVPTREEVETKNWIVESRRDGWFTKAFAIHECICDNGLLLAEHGESKAKCKCGHEKNVPSAVRSRGIKLQCRIRGADASIRAKGGGSGSSFPI